MLPQPAPLRFPLTRGQSGGETRHAGLDDLRRQLREAGHSAAHVGIKIGFRVLPKGPEKTVLAVVGHEQRLHAHVAQHAGKGLEAREAGAIEVQDGGKIHVRQPEPLERRRIPGQDDDALSGHALQRCQPGGLIAPVVDGQEQGHAVVVYWKTA